MQWEEFAITSAHSFARPCFSKQTKEATVPLSACVADISHNDDSHYSMHPTKFNNNLTFSTAAVSMTTRAPAATLKHDKHKSQKMDLIDLASLHGTDIKADRGV